LGQIDHLPTCALEKWVRKHTTEAGDMDKNDTLQQLLGGCQGLLTTAWKRRPGEKISYGVIHFWWVAYGFNWDMSSP